MTNSISSDSISMFFTPLIQELRGDLSHPIGFMQVGAIGVTYLIAWLFASTLQKYLEKSTEKVKAHMRLVLSPPHFALMFKYFFWLLLLWFSQVFFKRIEIPHSLFHMALSLVITLLTIRFASFYIKSTFWTRFVYAVIVIVLSLRIVKLWEPTVHLLNSMTFELGKMSVSVGGLIEAIFVFILLWAAAGAANRFFAHWLVTSTHLTYSDRTLIQRVSKAATTVVVALITLKAAGIHLAAVVVTGGAIGFAVGIGLQKIGSNLVSGIMLLISKPIRKGDVIVLDSLVGDSYGWVIQIGLNYVQVATRNGSLELIPNEVFVTKKIENLSYNDNLIRISIPFGISYKSDLKKAIGIGLNAAMSIDRILKIPEPKCIVKEFGDSTVNLQLRAWINDPQNGMANVKDAVLLAVWDGFHENGIEIAFPQRDLHIKDTVPVKVLIDR